MKIWKVRLKRRCNPKVNATRFVEATMIHTAIARSIRDIQDTLDISDGVVTHAVEFDNNKKMDQFYTDNPDLRDCCLYDGEILEPEPEPQMTLDSLNNIVPVTEEIKNDKTDRDRSGVPARRRAGGPPGKLPRPR